MEMDYRMAYMTEADYVLLSDAYSKLVSLAKGSFSLDLPGETNMSKAAHALLLVLLDYERR